MADEGAAPAAKKSGDSNIKQLLLVAAAIVVVQALGTYFFVVRDLQHQRDAAEDVRTEAATGGKKSRKATAYRPGEKASESGEIELKDLVININPQGGGTKSYLSLSISLEYELSEAEVKTYRETIKARGAGSGGGEGGDGGSSKVFEKVERTKIVDKVIEFFSSKQESELIAGGAGRRALRRQLRHTLNWMIDHPNSEAPPPLAHSLSPSATAAEGGGADGERGEGSGTVEDEGSAHPIRDIYFTNFVMQ